ncbi:hypothetical protein RQM59_03570 [Flavobacteriaceae bacterium S356]|uniref:Uncharacterized protein n=1 Tax=Asprobacillus argus TaxID=3076534 RepID=A0ABU3LE01_9FLAO|nr:hypothetical protein [Flavobacteriaceae bacterium S356]
MKRLFSMLFLLAYSLVCAQKTTVGFTKSKQSFDFSKEYITLEVEIKDIKKYKSTDPIRLQIFSEVSDTIPVNIFPKEYTSPKKVMLFIDKEKLKDSRNFIVRLSKKEVNKNFEMSENDFISIVEKKKEKFTIGIEKLDDPSLILDTNKDLALRYTLTSSGYQVKKTDAVMLKVKFKDAIELEFPIESISQDKTYQSIILKKGEKNYDSIKKVLLKDRKLILELISATSKKNKNIEGAVDENKKMLTYTLQKKSGFENTYDIFLGSNFDIVEEFSASKFYAEINVFLPNLAKDRSGRTIFGMRGGIYKNNTSTKLEENARQEVILEPLAESPTDSISYVEKRVSSLPNVAIENLGLYVQGFYPIITRNEIFNLFVGLHVEVIQRSEKYTFDNTDLFTLSTSTISLDSLANNRILQAQLARSKSFTRRYVDSYFGLSLPMLYKLSDENRSTNLEVMINPGVGFGDPGLTPARQRSAIKAYGLTQFHVIFGAKDGVTFKIGGEVRKYFNFFQDPIVTINFSTKINLETLFKKS